MSRRLSPDEVPHGTYAGYRWHQRWGMPACDACRAANTAYHASHIPADQPAPSPEKRFLSKVLIGDGCWEWQGSLTADGYGRWKAPEGSSPSVHRYAYELFVAPIPAGLTIDHLCRNRRCVNPTHLEPVTGPENTRRRAKPLPMCERCGQTVKQHRSRFCSIACRGGGPGRGHSSEDFWRAHEQRKASELVELFTERHSLCGGASDE